jgi:hypothetical protein
MADGLSIPMHRVYIDDAGRVVIDDPEVSAAVRIMLQGRGAIRAAVAAGEADIDNLEISTNVGCVNLNPKCIAGVEQ